MVRRIARRALASCLDELLVVVGFEASRVRPALEGLDVTVIENPDYAEGQSTSVKAGLRAVNEGAAAAMFLPADQPFLDPATIDRLITAYLEQGGRIVLPVCANRRGAPVILDRSLFAELAEITGDTGGRQLFTRYPEEILEVPLPSERPLLDVDTEERYRQLLAELETSN